MSQKTVFAIQPFEMGGGGTPHRSLVIVIPAAVVKALTLSKSSILELRLDSELKKITLQPLNTPEVIEENASP
ncbi:hypothetical protein Ngar_c16990 [Candidatus Nitrososphaera gargensis Ga9.2]|uniref:SpoVT-AbrB domain-containing protein n=1 Tax=Nitrososphaera gargensis (strain Ga9.2) TaxID=1237085 RepID=K0IK17_NITGG|nr:hypothetical protein Ngar_c16990 [Candidatus Nitrososphaera gargensis Ga9.2]